MVREEIVNEIKCILSELNNGEDAVSYLTQNDMKWLNENIKVLEQEPFINKPCVSSEVCEHDKNKALDKIRAEIEYIGGDDEKAFCKNLNESYKQGLKDALKVIDKYKTESEE